MTKAAVIGLGRMGRRHIQALEALGLDIVGGADTNAASRADVARDHRLSPASLFASAEELLAKVQPDVVVVATTAPSHGELACLAAKSGARYVLCEKPMATSLAECDAMIAACRERGVKLAVNHPMRFMEQYTRIREVIESPDFGGWRSITVAGGNVGMAMNGTHYFELLRWLSDEDPVQATAWFDREKVPNPRGPQFHDRAGAVRVTTASGRRLFLELGGDQGHGLRVVYSGRWGIASADDLNGQIEVSLRASEHRDAPTTRYAMPSTQQTLTVAAADPLAPTQRVLEALLSDGDFPTGEQGRTAVATLVACHVSDEAGGCAVNVDLQSLPRARCFDYA